MLDECLKSLVDGRWTLTAGGLGANTTEWLTEGGLGLRLQREDLRLIVKTTWIGLEINTTEGLTEGRFGLGLHRG